MTGICRKNMKIVILLSSIAIVTASHGNPPPRSVNVALETSFLFDPKDMNENKSFVNHIRRFLDKLYKILEPQTPEKQFRSEKKHSKEEKRLGEFIEIMQGIGQNFLNMTAPKIKEAFDTIHVEVKNITEKQPAMLSQVLPPGTQGIVKELINTWVHSTNPDAIKVLINTTVRENKPMLKMFARRMNSYYNANEVKDLNKILKKFKRNIDTNKDTKKIVKKLLHNTIFKKYDNLNESAKAAVMEDLKVLSEFLIAKNSATGTETRRNSPINEVDKAAYPDDVTNTGLRRSIDEKNRNTREKNEVKKGTNDFVEGNVELYVEPPQNS